MVLFLQLYLILEFVFDLLIDLLLEVLSESLAQFQARILMLNPDELIPCFVLYSILNSEIIECHSLVVPVFVVDLVLVYFYCEKLVEKDHRKETKEYVHARKKLFYTQILL